MGVNRPSVAGETSFPLQYARSKKYKALSFARSLGLLALSFFALMLIPDKGWSQQRGPSALSQQGGQSSAHRLYASRAGKSPDHRHPRDPRGPRDRADITFGPGTRVV